MSQESKSTARDQEVKSAEKDTKKVFESYYEVAKHRLGRPPTPDEVLQIMTEEQSAVEKSEFPTAESVPMPGRQTNDSKPTETGPAILYMKVYFGKKDDKPDPNEILYYEHPKGMVYDVENEEWLPSKPSIVNHLPSRPMGFQEKDMISAILHGVMGDADYEALDSRSMIGDTPRKLWDLKKKLEGQLEELKRADSNDEDIEDLSKSDDSEPEESDDRQEDNSENLQSDENSQIVNNPDEADPESEGVSGEDLIKQIISEAMSPGTLGPYIEEAVRKVLGDKPIE